MTTVVDILYILLPFLFRIIFVIRKAKASVYMSTLISNVILTGFICIE